MRGQYEVAKAAREASDALAAARRLRTVQYVPPLPPVSNRQAELTARADRRRARRNGDA